MMKEKRFNITYFLKEMQNNTTTEKFYCDRVKFRKGVIIS